MIDALSKLVAIDLDTIIDKNDKFFTFNEVADKLQLIKDTAQDVIDNQSYISELPERVQEVTSNKLLELVNVLNEIQANRDNRDWMSANYTNRCTRITDIYNELYENFIRGVREYVNSLSSTRKAAQQQLRQLRNANKRASETTTKTEGTLRLAEEATSELSAVTLSEHFDSEVFREAEGKPDIAALARWKRWSWMRRFWRKWISATGYDVSAGRWLILSLMAAIGTSYLAYRELHGVNLNNITINTVLAKALLLLAPAYVIRFCGKNYNASKHLATVNRQRGVVMKTLIALMTHSGITEPVKEQAIVAAVNQVFSASESGYISSKTGSDDQDKVIDLSAIKNLQN